MFKSASISHFLCRWLLIAGMSVVPLWLVGQVFRDRVWLTALSFYIPSPVMAIWFIAATVLALRERKRGLASVCAFLALLPLTMTFFVENRWARFEDVEPSSGNHRLVHWNVCRGTMGWKNVLRVLQEQHADAYVVSEVPTDYDTRTLQSDFGSEYEAVRAGSMAIIARGHLVRGRWVVKQSGLRIYSAWWERDQQTVQIFAVDVVSSIWISRHVLLAELVARMAEFQPDIVVGDLNSPRRSLSLSTLPSGYTHAYATAGRGWSYTWPVPVPVLAIDQCIISHHIQPLRYELQSTVYSDHRMQVLEFRFR